MEREEVISCGTKDGMEGRLAGGKLRRKGRGSQGGKGKKVERYLGTEEGK